jgi:hypothetical protein
VLIVGFATEIASLWAFKDHHSDVEEVFFEKDDGIVDWAYVALFHRPSDDG